MPAGYSRTPLAKKLGVKDGQAVALVGAADTWQIPDLEPGVSYVATSVGTLTW